MNTVKTYEVLIKRNNYYTVIIFQAENDADALTFAQSKGEVVLDENNNPIITCTEVPSGDIDYHEQMLNYYPEIIKAIREFNALVETQSDNVEDIHEELTKILSNAYISTADIDRIAEWERLLGIILLSQGTDSMETWLSDRRETIAARLYTPTKLNTESISNLVRIFTNGSTNSWFRDGVLYVAITPPENGKTFKFDNLKQEIEKKIPAHLTLIINLGYYIWLQVKNTYPTWGDVKADDKTWNDVFSFSQS